MNVSVGNRWEGFIDAVVREGRSGPASGAVREGLRRMEERETRLQSLLPDPRRVDRPRDDVVDILHARHDVGGHSPDVSDAP